ncbi:unnamed protein product, partial [Closterium sp. Naga37s-1]
FPLSLLPALLLLCRLLRTLLPSLPLTGRNGARVARRAGREVEEAVVVAEAAVVPQEEGALEEVQDRQARLLAVFRPAGVSDLSSSSHSSTSHSRDSSTSRDSSSSRHRSSSSLGGPHCSGVRSSTEAPRRSGAQEDQGAPAAAAAVPAGPLAPLAVTLAPVTTGASPDWAASAVASLSFTLDSGASQCFFRDHTTLTPLLAPVPVALADPSSGPAMARSSTTLPCPVVPSGVLCGLHIPSFTRNLVGVGYLQDRGITVTFVGGGRTAVCTDVVTGRVLATFTREPRSDLYVLHTEHSPVSTSPQVAASPHVPAPPPVVESSQVVASPPVVVSGQVVASCSCQSFTNRTVLWHHRLGHPSIPRLRTMASHRLVSSLPRVLPSLPPSPAPPCTPCIAGRLRAAPHSSSLRPATAPFQTLHLDVWGPAPTQGPERERYFLVVVDDFSRYTTVFPLAKKSEVTSTLIRWLLATEGTRGRRVSCLHSDRGGEFRSGILAGFCGEQGIVQSWTLSESPQQNGVAERRIGLVMDIARTSMIHAHEPHFLWPAHQLNLQLRVSRPEASPTSLWTRSPGVGSACCVWGCLALVRDTSAVNLSARAVPCVFLSFPVASADWSFYHPPLHHFLDSRDVRFDESVSYYTRYPCRGLSVPPPPLFLAPSLPPAPAPPVTVDSVGVGAGGAATGDARSGGARSRGAGAGGAGTGGASSGGAGAGGAGTGGASSGGAGVGGPGTGGARTGGVGAGDPDPVGTPSGDTGSGGC